MKVIANIKFYDCLLVVLHEEKLEIGVPFLFIMFTLKETFNVSKIMFAVYISSDPVCLVFYT